MHAFQMAIFDGLREAFGWGSPIGLAAFFIGVGIMMKLAGWGGGGSDKK